MFRVEISVALFLWTWQCGLGQNIFVLLEHIVLIHTLMSIALDDADKTKIYALEYEASNKTFLEFDLEVTFHILELSLLTKKKYIWDIRQVASAKNTTRVTRCIDFI
ncbi:hypothetical protein M758_10G187900 [Ceratodon purpureus]|uniref:Uncharacterized protein n=1 Tax=Ceratodon purpureus TaxID=3225 RepID=A0A8T0GNU5_CERPU|nr:hypothetical protein KC19_10G192300 [Ceratodon purpureus]KAG0560609.1 hypothetical protein KC19_10G192900 [Ceratodon purpureus]KAG0604679.1 hypothetical protein M758_10G187900 [Ceratodon purpureus]